MKNCKDCKNWNKIPHREGYGFCQSEKWNRHPSHYEDSDKVTELDMVEVTYTPVTGNMFGCIHFDNYDFF